MDKITEAYQAMLSPDTPAPVKRLLERGWHMRQPLSEVSGTHDDPDLLKELNDGITAYVFSGSDEGYEDSPVFVVTLSNDDDSYYPEETYGSLEEMMNGFIAWYAEESSKDPADIYPEMLAAMKQVAEDFNEVLKEL